MYNLQQLFETLHEAVKSVIPGTKLSANSVLQTTHRTLHRIMCFYLLIVAPKAPSIAEEPRARSSAYKSGVLPRTFYVLFRVRTLRYSAYRGVLHSSWCISTARIDFLVAPGTDMRYSAYRKVLLTVQTRVIAGTKMSSIGYAYI